MDVKWVMHRMIRIHFIHDADLDLVADTETPVD